MANQHVVPVKDKWGVRREKALRYTTLVDTQEEAFETARDIAENQGGEVLVHNRKGVIRDKNTYGTTDHHPPKG